MKKYGTPEKAEVFAGEEATVINRHLARVGKALSEFSQEEIDALNKDLGRVSESEAEVEPEDEDEK